MIKILLKLLTFYVGISQAHLLNATCYHEVFADPDLSVCKILPESQPIHHENTTIVLNITDPKSLKGLIAEDMEMHFIPTGIEKFFEKLILLKIKNTGLRKVDKQNLVNFIDLIYLDLSYNQIEILEHDLFTKNKYLSAIVLNSNRIKVVEENVFNSLHNLNFIDFRNNKCYSGMTNEQQKIALLVKQIQTVCLNYNLKLWNHISNNNEKFNNLTLENVKMREEINKISKQISNNTSSDIKLRDQKQSESNQHYVLVILAILIIIGVFVLIILALVIIFLNLNHQKLKFRNNKVQPYETVMNFTRPNDYKASTIDAPKENCENFYQELPCDDITSVNVINNSEYNDKIDDTYSEVETTTEPVTSNETAVLYAVVNKNAN